jgi:hypothetical protein
MHINTPYDHVLDENSPNNKKAQWRQCSLGIFSSDTTVQQETHNFLSDWNCRVITQGWENFSMSHQKSSYLRSSGNGESSRLWLLPLWVVIVVVHVDGGETVSVSVSELRLPTDQLFIPLIYQYGERLWNYIYRGKPDELGKKLVPVPLCPPQITQGTDPGANPGLRGQRGVTNRLSHMSTHSVPIMNQPLSQIFTQSLATRSVG